MQSSWLTEWKNGKLIGYLADVLDLLKETINFKIKHVKEESDAGTWNEDRKTWSGAVGLIVAGEVDLVVSDLSITPQRMFSADFSVPLLSTQDALYVKKPSNKNAIIWTGYFQV